MSIDGKILARAKRKLAALKKEREDELARRRDRVYDRVPRVRDIDRELRMLMAEAALNALKKDGGAAIADISGRSLDLQADRAELLVGAGYAIDYLDDKPACGECSDLGFTTDGRMCRCLKVLYDREMAAELSSLLKMGEETFKTFKLGYYEGGRDPDSDESPREHMATILQICEVFANRFGSHQENLFFQGPPGLGKTFLSACIARVVSERGFSVVYDTAVAILETFEMQKFSPRGTEDAEEAGAAVRRFLRADLLILDDLGTEMNSPFYVSALYTLINTRLTSGKQTVISTNLEEKELRQRYTPAIMSRLEGEYEWLTFAGRDIRAIKKEG